MIAALHKDVLVWYFTFLEFRILWIFLLFKPSKIMSNFNATFMLQNLEVFEYFVIAYGY